jgi:hypothetical protein
VEGVRSGPGSAVLSDAGERLSPPRALLSVFLSPEETFRAAGRGAGPALPLVLGAALTALFSYFSIQPVLDVMARDPSMALSPDDLARVSGTIRATRLLIVALVPAGYLLRTVFVSAVLWSSLQLRDVDLPFAPLFACASYASAVKCLQAGLVSLVTVLRAGWATSVRDLAPRIGLNLAVPDLPRPVDALLGTVNLFDVWHLALLVVAVRVTTGIATSRAVLAVVPLWLVGTLLVVGVAFLG